MVVAITAIKANKWVNLMINEFDLRSIILNVADSGLEIRCLGGREACQGQ